MCVFACPACLPAFMSGGTGLTACWTGLWVAVKQWSMHWSGEVTEGFGALGISGVLGRVTKVNPAREEGCMGEGGHADTSIAQPALGWSKPPCHVRPQAAPGVLLLYCTHPGLFSVVQPSLNMPTHTHILPPDFMMVDLAFVESTVPQCTPLT